MAKTNQKKDGCSQQKTEICTYSNKLILCHYYYFKSLQPLLISIQEWEFYIWTVKLFETFHNIKLIRLSSVHLKRVWEVVIFIFLNINRESRVHSIKFSSWVGKNVDYMEILEFSSQVEIFTCNCNATLKGSLLLSRNEISTRFDKLKFQPGLKTSI